MLPEDPRHGTYAGGRVHRGDNEDVCQPCRDAEARYEQARVLDRLSGRPRVVPAIGTKRRIHALVALGHSFARIAEALGMSTGGAWALAHKMGTDARATTAAKVASLYEAWSMTLPPSTTSTDRKAAAYARSVARKHGWVPPLAWDDIDHDDHPADVTSREPAVDEAAVLRRLAWDTTVPLTRAERFEVVRRAREAGWSFLDIEQRTGIGKPARYLTSDQEDAA